MVETRYSSSCFGFEKGNEYLTISKQFQDLASKYFESVSSKHDWSIDQIHDFLNHEDYATLYSVYPQPSVGKQIWDDISKAINHFASKKSIDEVKKLYR